ncbi:MAG: sodium:solute symporter family protein [Thermoanaerobaculia bacterium]
MGFWDFALIGLYLVFAVAVGSFFTRKASRGIESFFVGDRRLPWWIAGTSMVATTFAADTPLAVTGIVAADGISGNWIWWCWAIAHLVSTFFFARMWQRSGVITDAEIIELRYAGRPAAILRGVKAAYFGLFINCLTMAWVMAAMIKIARAFFDIEPGWVVAGCVLVSVLYTTLGGFRSVVITDLVQFGLGMVGAIVLAVLVVGQMGGMGSAPTNNEAGSGLLGELASTVEAEGRRTFEDVLDFVPPRDHPTIPPIYFAVLLTVGWWRYAEGNGYLVQRMAACRDEGHAQGASLWFSVAHNALRPWPWIVVALAALVFYPRLPGQPAGELRQSVVDIDGSELQLTVGPDRVDVATGGELRLTGFPTDCQATLADQTVPLEADPTGEQLAHFAGFADSGLFDLVVSCPDLPRGAETELRFPGMRIELTDREMAYPLMMGRTLPPGVLGLVVASLLAAFMSTIDTHTNWGASYLVQDLYRRFLVTEADSRHYVLVSRICVVLMAALAGLTSLFIHDIASVWRFLLTLGAGLGSVSAARWYWSRVTPYAEFAALGVSTALAISMEVFFTPTLFGGPNPWFVTALPAWQKILIIAFASLGTWIPVALWGPRNKADTLRQFASKVRPPGRSWAPYRTGPADPIEPAILRFAAGLAVVFGTLFGTGDLLLGNVIRGSIEVVAAMVLLLMIVRSGRVGHRGVRA